MSALDDAFAELVRNVLREELREELAQQAQQQEAKQAYYSVRQAADFCGVTEHAIRAALKTGRLKRERRGDRSIALTRQSLDDWMKGRS